MARRADGLARKIWIGAQVARLSSDRFSDREDATRELRAVGYPAVPALRQAANSSDG